MGVGVGVGEGPLEGRERRCARAAPAVDGLVRVADRGDGRAGEERAQELELGVRGVLELVEEDDAEALPFDRGDVGEGASQPRCEGHLVGEVHRVPRRLEVGVAARHVHGHAPGPQRGGHVAQVLGEGPGSGPQRQGVEGPGTVPEVLLDGVQVDEVFGQLPREGEGRVGEGGLGEVEVADVTVEAHCRLVGELPGRGLREEADGGLDTEPHPVVGDDRAGVGVVGRDRRPSGEDVGRAGGRLRRCRRGPQPRLPQGPQATLDTRGQLTRGLAGEGQSEHLVRLDESVGHEPDDPGGHRLGLARPGAGDDEQRLHRRLDDGGLLGCRVVSEAEGSSDVDRAQPRWGRRVRQPRGLLQRRGLRKCRDREDAAHASAAPSGWAGHVRRTGHR